MRQKMMILALALTLMLGFSACKDGGKVLNPTGDEFNTQAFVLPESDVTPSTVVDATIETDAAIVEPTCDVCELIREPQRQPPKMRPHPMLRILRDMKLSEDQVAQVKEFMTSHRECMHTIMLRLRETERDILQTANEARRGIMEQLKNGDIDRQEAARLLTALNLRTREALHNNPARIVACEAMKVCTKELFRNIRSILTEEQQKLWDEWVAKIPEVDCNRIQ